jgi:hypothetical protein
LQGGETEVLMPQEISRAARRATGGPAPRRAGAAAQQPGPHARVVALQRLAGNRAVSGLLAPTVQRQPGRSPSPAITPPGKLDVDAGEQATGQLSVNPAGAAAGHRFRWELKSVPRGVSASLDRDGPTSTLKVFGTRPGTVLLRIQLFVDADAKGRPLPVEISVHPSRSGHGAGAVGTWGDSTFDADTYERIRKVGSATGEGVQMALRFRPGESVDAEAVAMIQTVKASRRGAPHLPDRKDDEATARVVGARSVAAGPGAGTHIDPSGRGGTPESAAKSTNPMYATDAEDFNPASTSLESAALADTRDQYGQHGWRYADRDGTPHVQDAVLGDSPFMTDPGPNSGQVFETTALAVRGAQKGTYYGSVQWGWTTDAKGIYTQLPLTRVSEDAPSAVFAEAAALWNDTPTSEGEPALALPSATIMSSVGGILMQAPSLTAARIGPLGAADRLEVTDQPASGSPATRSEGWRRVTVLDGPLAGRAGWVQAWKLVLP